MTSVLVKNTKHVVLVNIPCVAVDRNVYPEQESVPEIVLKGRI